MNAPHWPDCPEGDHPDSPRSRHAVYVFIFPMICWCYTLWQRYDVKQVPMTVLDMWRTRARRYVERFEHSPYFRVMRHAAIMPTFSPISIAARPRIGRVSSRQLRANGWDPTARRVQIIVDGADNNTAIMP
jgi:hypothetical protein